MNQAQTAKPLPMTLSAISLFLSLHKWTAMMFGGVLLTVPAAMETLPESAGVLGIFAFLFGAWKQKEEMKMKRQIHEEKMHLLRDLRAKVVSGEVVLDAETVRELLG